ncbi:arylamine N-acetyltransferase [Actinoplanes sp. LDG1-06]|uniref:Arylamine N-acetyltransferase n=1 Tax=Paractinoplanes ovalisporus TaxID=2810368 RepID=A0ABS2AEN3_9ACTN|nr:arylamine N-acetyltransferase [Actinoplanes ovalisporus]MBM2618297.1 arylamine N-acetyltransferase [Actinoplanes ovalisporus]
MDVNAYLARIDLDRPLTPDAAGLRELHRAHQRTVPFENLSIHLGETISLDPGALFDKIVRRRRGGFCYELNGLFALLLEDLGFEVERVGARVHGERLGPPFDHLALLVTAPDGDGPWLADVGFGRHSTDPLDFRRTEPQTDPGGVFTLVDVHGSDDVDVTLDGKPQYRIERRVRALTDFIPTCWWHSTSPDSHFGRAPVCSRLDGDGRVSLSGRTLIRTGGGQRTETVLDTDEQVLAAYRENFGIVLGRVPTPPVRLAPPAPPASPAHHAPSASPPPPDRHAPPATPSPAARHAPPTPPAPPAP